MGAAPEPLAGGVPAPCVRGGSLGAHVGKAVQVAGKVVSADGQTLQLDCGDGATVRVRRAADRPPAAPAPAPGSHALVRGVVQPDAAVLESAAYPLTDLGPSFDLSLHNDAVDLMMQAQFRSLFSN